VISPEQLDCVARTLPMEFEAFVRLAFETGMAATDIEQISLADLRHTMPYEQALLAARSVGRKKTRFINISQAAVVWAATVSQNKPAAAMAIHLFRQRAIALGYGNLRWSALSETTGSDR
jgi:hypothetical protein